MSTQTEPALTRSADELEGKNRVFVTPDGKNVLFTFCLVSTLFLLWGFCNGMIDVMDKHFQKELNLTLSQSAWVQFAHWIGYFIMSVPAGYLATRLGYKFGILAGLVMVSIGGFWFIPATSLATFWAFLLGVCLVAAGLTFLETVCNPYTTVLGAPRYAAMRINMAQSLNGIGWILGPIAGGLFFYGQDATGRSTGAETLWIPYAGVGVVVLLLAVMFFFAPVPDIRAKDDYDIDANDGTAEAPAVRKVNRGLSYFLLLGNAAALIGVFGMITWLVLDSLGVGPSLVGFVRALPISDGMAVNSHTALLTTIFIGGIATLVLAAIWLIFVVNKLTHHSIWSHEHFTGATLAQFFYMAAQAGIFAFLINYMTAEPPSLPRSWLDKDNKSWVSDWIEVEYRTAFTGRDFKDVAALTNKLTAPNNALTIWMNEKLSDNTQKTLELYKAGNATQTAARIAIMQDLNGMVRKGTIWAPERFEGIELSDATQELLAEDPETRNELRLNRLLLTDAFGEELDYHEGVVSVTDKFASNLVSFGFICFLIGRVTGSWMLRKVSAHKLVGLYALLNVFACTLVVLKLGWISVGCVFLTYFFMSIMFPTIFALGIFGLGVKAKGASAYIVMAIAGGALLPKLMGAIADHYDMSRGFMVPLVSFMLVAIYGYAWPKLSRVDSLHGVSASGGH